MNNVTKDEAKVNRTYKARIFAMLFEDKANLLELYNAVNGTHYDDPEALVVNTLENAIYMSMNNDVSFIIDSRLTLYEHQSTFSPNLPLRFLFYVADLYSSFVRDKNLYGTKLIKLDTPHFIIFYNGSEEYPNRMRLRLSDAFEVTEKKPALELTATMLNINMGKNRKLMKASRTLWGYAEYTRRVREYAETMGSLEEAVERAISECIREGILADFLNKNRAEAKRMSIYELYEYDAEKYNRMSWEDGREDGYKEGREDGMRAGEARAKKVFRLNREGKTPEEIAEACKVTVEKVRELLSED